MQFSRKDRRLGITLRATAALLAAGFAWHTYQVYRLNRFLKEMYSGQRSTDTQISASINPVTDAVTIRLVVVPDYDNPFSTLGSALAGAVAPSVIEPQFQGLIASDKQFHSDPYAAIVPYAFRVVTTTADAETMRRALFSRAMEKHEIERKAQEEKNKKMAEVRSYVRSGLELQNVRVAWGERYGNRERAVFGTLVNNGDKTLTKVTVRSYFLDAQGKHIGEKDFSRSS